MRAGTSRFTRGLAGLLTFGSLIVFAPPAGTEGALPDHPDHLVRLASTARPALLQGAKLLGHAPATKRLDLEVTLRLPDAGALQRFVADVNDRKSPLFGRFLAPGAFGARFGPSLQQVAVVVGALRLAGLHPGPVLANRLAIPVSASVGAIDKALSTSIDVYRLADGREVYANASAPALPAQAAGLVDAVLGLDDIGRVHDMMMRANPVRRRASPIRAAADSVGPQPCSNAKQAGLFGGVTSNILAQHYGLTPLYGLGDLGAGVRVAIVEFEPHATSDIATFESCYSISTHVNTIAIDGGSGTGPGSGESALDIEDVAGLSPEVTIDVYNAPASGTDAEVEAEYGAIISADKDKVISSSWGECELDSHQALLTSEASLFEEAAAQGESVLAAAGDYGSTDCYNPNFSQPNPTKVSADDPGSEPDVVSVGGTVLKSHDAVWNESSIFEGATGGAVSATHCMPTYQDQPKIAGVFSRDSKKGCGGKSSVYFRQTPDVVADADPTTGIVIYYGGNRASWMSIGGTSMSAPLWAAIAALVDASPFCSFYGAGDAGARPAGLYDIAASGFQSHALTDVTSGNNDYTPSGYSGGLYPSTTGYDMASGLGYPNVVRYVSGSSKTPDFYSPGLAALMCHRYARRNLTPQITVISSGVAKNGEIPVLIQGHGFLPVAGAERIVVGNTASGSISCTSSTECTATLPGSARSGTPSVAILVEDLSRTTPFPYSYSPEGYWLASSDGSVSAVGSAPALGGVTVSRSAPLVGIAEAPGGHGYWLVSSNGSVYAKGTAHYERSLPAYRVRVDDIVALAPTADGHGYWMIGRDGGEFAFGDARYHGSLPGLGVHVKNIVGMVATADGGGYWLVGADGGVFAFGDATFKGSLPRDGVHVDDIRAMIASPTRKGYVLVGSDGGTFAFGTGVRFFGSLPGRGVHVDDIAGLALTTDAGGYWLAGSDATVYAFGDAFAYPPPGSARANLPIVAIATS